MHGGREEVDDRLGRHPNRGEFHCAATELRKTLRAHAQHVRVELHAALDVGDVEDDVVEGVDLERHAATCLSGRRIGPALEAERAFSPQARFSFTAIAWSPPLRFLTGVAFISLDAVAV
jgi:hypothetical protein